MEASLGLLLVLIATLAIIHLVQAQDQQEFISLDCGLPANEQSPYNETYTRLHFSSDATFIQSGKTGRIQANLVSKWLKPYTTLRYFPDGIRNCYSLSVEKGRKYLIRASFVYGDYDGRNIKPVFDLYLGPNLWATIDLETRVNEFISLDCGLPANEQSPYNETYTRLHFSSDATFIQSGKTGRIQANLVSKWLKPYTTLRYFPDGIRNCYSLSVEKGRKYLIRASFVYGDYDGRNIKPVFDLYLGPNLWATIDLETRVNGTRKDILHIPTSNSLQICLVKTGKTRPLISALELRPMGNDSYITKSGSLNLIFWYYLRNSGSQLRYSGDIYDRIWLSYFKKEWTEISTNLDVGNSNIYAPPEAALKTAATPTNTSAPLTIEWSSANPDEQYYLYLHFAEIQELQANQTREFNILLNGQHFMAL